MSSELRMINLGRFWLEREIYIHILSEICFIESIEIGPLEFMEGNCHEYC